jgi:hypothetical protein
MERAIAAPIRSGVEASGGRPSVGPPRGSRREWFLISALAFAGLVCSRDGSALTFSPDQLPPGRVGERYEATITISENETPVGEVYISQGELPPGLSLFHNRGESTAAISGVPQRAGSFAVTVSAWCYGTNVAGQTGQREYELHVEDAAALP